MQLLYSVLLLLSGLGIFLYGIHNISVGMQSVASNQLKKSLRNMSKNPFRSFTTGFGATLLVQNSSVTTVLIVGLLNTGLVSLYHALSMILGCKVGASLILILFSFENLSLVEFFAVLVFAGAIIAMFGKTNKIQRLGKTIAGFGMLFCGLNIMSLAVGDMMQVESVRNFVANISNVGILFVVGLFLGATFHVLGTTALMVSLMNLESSPFTLLSAVIIVLGANIGSTITMILASLNSNVHSKRASFFYTSTNLIAGLSVLLIVCVTPFVDWLNSILNSPALTIITICIAQSVVFSLLFMPLLQPIEKLLTILIVDKSTAKEKRQEVFTITNAELKNFIVVRQKLLHCTKIILTSLKSIYQSIQKNFLFSQSKPNLKTLKNSIATISKRIEDTKIIILRADNDSDEENYKWLNIQSSAIAECEKSVSVAYNLLDCIDKMKAEQHSLISTEKKLIDEILNKINTLFDDNISIYENQINAVAINEDQANKIIDLEDEFSHLKTQAKKVLYKNIAKEKSKIDSDLLFNIFTRLDQACDSLINLAIKII